MKITELTRPVKRRIGELVVTLLPEGLSLRRKGARRGARVSYEDLVRDIVPLPARTGREAFAAPPARLWQPAAGDCVWLREPGWALARRGRVVRLLPGLPELLVRVRVGGRDVDCLLQYLRPAVAPKGSGA